MDNHMPNRWHESPEYTDLLFDPKMRTWVSTGRMLTSLVEEGEPLPDQGHKEAIIKDLADEELRRLKPRTWQTK